MPMQNLARIALMALVVAAAPHSAAEADAGAWPAAFRGAVAAAPTPALYAYDFTDRTVGDTVTVTRGQIDPKSPQGAARDDIRDNGGSRQPEAPRPAL